MGILRRSRSLLCAAVEAAAASAPEPAAVSAVPTLARASGVRTRLKARRRGGKSIVFRHPRSVPDGKGGATAAGEAVAEGVVMQGLTPLNRPLFKVAHGGYWAVRIPLLRAGFLRVARDSLLPCNLVWRRPFSLTKGSAERNIENDGEPTTTTATGASSVGALKPTFREQWTNHIPSTYTHLGSKDGMYAAIRALQARVPDRPLNITPETWILPEDVSELAAHAAANTDETNILKPARGSCGREISVVTPGSGKLRRLMEYATAPEPRPSADSAAPRLRKKKWIVQRYVDPPMLIDERKFDIRLYVAVTSMRPLVAYIYREGLVRFASEPYGSDTRLSQLTNSSLSRKRESALKKDSAAGSPEQERPVAAAASPVAAMTEPPLIADEDLMPWEVRSRDACAPPPFSAAVDAATARDTDAAGQATVEPAAGSEEDPSWPRFKWSLSELKQHIKQARGEAAWDEAWRGVQDIVVKTLVAAERPVTEHLEEYDAGDVYTNQAFELFGFDVMFDADGKPWLIEVNCIPSLESTSRMDWEVKCGSTTALLDMLGMQTFEREAEDTVWSQTHTHLLSSNTSFLSPEPASKGRRRARGPQRRAQEDKGGGCSGGGCCCCGCGRLRRRHRFCLCRCLCRRRRRRRRGCGDRDRSLAGPPCAACGAEGGDPPPAAAGACGARLGRGRVRCAGGGRGRARGGLRADLPHTRLRGGERAVLPRLPVGNAEPRPVERNGPRAAGYGGDCSGCMNRTLTHATPPCSPPSPPPLTSFHPPQAPTPTPLSWVGCGWGGGFIFSTPFL